VSWIVLPDTVLTKPSISSWPIGGGGGCLGEVGDGLAELADVLGFPAFSLLELPHAASDKTVAAVTARIARWVNRWCCVGELIKVPAYLDNCQSSP
jgi:hypothetical protein